MTKVSQHKWKRLRRPGAALAFLALGIQALLPFLVAFEIALAGRPAYADTIYICSATHPTTPSAPHEPGGTPHHGLSDGCPICLALAAGQAFTAAAPIAFPLPEASAGAIYRDLAAARPHVIAAAAYNPRAPPAIG